MTLLYICYGVLLLYRAYQTLKQRRIRLMLTRNNNLTNRFIIWGSIERTPTYRLDVIA